MQLFCHKGAKIDLHTNNFLQESIAAYEFMGFEACQDVDQCVTLSINGVISMTTYTFGLAWMKYLSHVYRNYKENQVVIDGNPSPTCCRIARFVNHALLSVINKALTDIEIVEYYSAKYLYR